MMHTDRIQKYLDGKMEEEELKRFRDDMQKDPELLKELDLHRSLDEILISKDEERFKKKLNEAYKAYKIKVSDTSEPKAVGRKRYIFRKAAIYISVSVIILFAIYFQLFRKESNKTIFNNYLSSYINESARRDNSNSGENNTALSRGVKLYLQGNYSEASQLFTFFLNQNAGNVDAHFYNGLCYIYLNEFENAISSFDFVLGQPYNYYQEYAKWYLSLCYIKTNKNQTARILLKELTEEKGYFSFKAKKILRKLR